MSKTRIESTTDLTKGDKHIIHGAAAVITVLLLFIMLLTAVETVCYRLPNWYKNEYEKYEVTGDLNREMTLSTLLDVTDEMMDYLKGDREDLVIYVTADGTRQEFFNDREKYHMADVRVLFVKAFALRRITVVITLLLLLALFLPAKKCGTRSDRLREFCKTVVRSEFVCLAAALLLTLVVAMDFDRAFTVFHHIFFNNDMWLFDPNTSDMINMLPEGFFADTVAMIVAFFLGSAVILGVVCHCIAKRLKQD